MGSNIYENYKQCKKKLLNSKDLGLASALLSGSEVPLVNTLEISVFYSPLG